MDKTDIPQISLSSLGQKRLSSLDGVRGMALLMVVLGHFIGFLGLFGKSSLYMQAFTSPLHLFFNSDDAVIVFFVLSGYVMHVPFIEADKRVSIIGFWVHRFFRLYPLYLLNIVFAYVACVYFFQRESLLAFNSELHIFWPNVPSMEELWQHVVPLLPSLTISATVNPVLWSLFVEWKMSLIFPLIIIAVKRLNLWQYALATCVIWVALWYSGNQYFKYLPMFMVGALGAHYKDRVNPSFFPLILLFGLLCGLNARFIFGGHDPYYYDSVTTIITVILLLLAALDKHVSAIFSFAPLVWLGRMTYPLYLFHFPILLVSLSFFNATIERRTTAWALAIITTTILTLVLSHVLHKRVEMPLTRFGRRLIPAVK